MDATLSSSKIPCKQFVSTKSLSSHHTFLIRILSAGGATDVSPVREHWELERFCAEKITVGDQKLKIKVEGECPEKSPSAFLPLACSASLPLLSHFELSAPSPISLSSLISNSRTLSFQALPHSFVFRIHLNPCHSNNFRTLAPKTGIHPLRGPTSPLVSAVGCRLSADSSPLSSFTRSLTRKQGVGGIGPTNPNRRL